MTEAGHTSTGDFIFATKTDACNEPTGYMGGVIREASRNPISFPQNFQILFHFEFEIDFKTYVNEIIFANPGNLAVFSAI